MRWFWRWVNRCINRATRAEEDDECEPRGKRGGGGNGIMLSSSSSDDENHLTDRNIRFTLLFAESGVILKRYHYDHKLDREINKLFLIHEDQDVAAEVGKIVALEMMRGV